MGYEGTILRNEAYWAGLIASQVKERDIDFVTGILGGDNHVIRAFFCKLYGKSKYWEIRRLEGGAVEALFQDICQVVTETIIKKLYNGNFKDIRNVLAYFKAVVKYQMSKENRRLAQLEPLYRESKENGKEYSIPVGLVESGERSTEIRQTLRKIINKELSPIEKDLFCLRYIERLSVKEVAAIVGITPNSAAVRLFLIRQKLLSKLRNLFED